MVLTVLFLLFCLRVLAQLIQAWHPVAFLPPFEAWASGVLPYWLLVLSQTLIVVLCARVIWRLYAGTIMPSPRMGTVLLVIGWFYLGLMCIRFIVGLTVASGHFWFGARLPTIFHFVLAAFVLVYGWFHYKASDAGHLQSLGKTT